MASFTLNEYIGKFTEVDAMYWKLTPLVRCKDCKYYHWDSRLQVGYCRVFADDYAVDGVKPDDYCSRGKRVDTE